MFRVLRQLNIPTRVRSALMGHQWKKLYNPAIFRRTDLNGTESDDFFFKSSVSLFNHVEEAGLRIWIIDKKSFSDAMGIKEAAELPPSSVTELYLDKIGPDQIRDFDPDNYPDQSKEVSSFLVKLRTVAISGTEVDVPHEVSHIDYMAIDLMKAVNYDDGRHLNTLRRTLGLSVGEEKFSARASREGKRGNGAIWAMQENKVAGNTRHKGGDIKLASCMIAAYQTNALYAPGVFPERMMAIKIVGDEFFFYSMKMAASYLESLNHGVPNEDIEVFKYPGEDFSKSKYHGSKLPEGLRISVPKERKQILDHLWSMRCYAVGLEKFKIRRQ